MDIILSHTVGLLIIAILIAIIVRRIHLPYTVGLVVAGIGITLSHVEAGVVLTHDIIFDVILPPLLFEAALNIHWSELRRDALPVLTLAILGVVISAAGALFDHPTELLRAVLDESIVALPESGAVVRIQGDSGQASNAFGGNQDYKGSLLASFRRQNGDLPAALHETDAPMRMKHILVNLGNTGGGQIEGTEGAAMSTKSLYERKRFP